MTTNANFIIADGRWSGTHGIGRFSTEVLMRLQHVDIFTQGPKPLSLTNLVWQTRQLYHYKNLYKVFFTPGFNPVIQKTLPFVVTIHDLIHLFVPGKAKLAKKIYYHYFIKSTLNKAYKVLTVSDYSKKTILQWAKIPEEKIVVVGNGISENLTPHGPIHNPGYPYLLHVGNNKVHKNIPRLVQAFSQAKIDSDTRLILIGQLTKELTALIKKNRLENRIVFSDTLSETTLAEYYRGARAVVFPSLYEGFGLPVLESMACGVPVLTSNITSLPEVAGDAALLVDPYQIDSLTLGIEKICEDMNLRENLIQKGLQRAKLFSWDKTAAKVQAVLNEANN